MATEQIALRLFLESSYEDFSRTLLSTNALFVLWGSFIDADDLAKRYLKLKGKSELADQRRSAASLPKTDVSLRNQVQTASTEAADFLEWARQNGGGQPLLRESLVRYCTAFETCLKNVALSFRLASELQLTLDGAVFVPSRQFSRTLKDVTEQWSQSRDRERSRAAVFFDESIVQVNPEPLRYRFLPSDNEEWTSCSAAFELRNAVVHELARPARQIELGESIFEPRVEIELRTSDLAMVRKSMERILFPLDPLSLLET